MDEVCDIVAHHHHPRSEDSVNFKCVYDADVITNLEEKHKENPMGAERLARILEKSLLTQSGRKLAEEVLSRAPK